MQLLHSQPYPVAEFACLSLLVEPPAKQQQRRRPSPADSTPSDNTAKEDGGDDGDGDGDGDGGGGVNGAGADEAAGPSQPAPPPPRFATTLTAESMTVVSPLATSSATSAHHALEELHAHLASIDDEERRAEEEFHRRVQLRKERREKRRKKEEEARAASQASPSASARRGGSSRRQQHFNRGDSIQTLETVGTDYDEDETDSEGEEGDAAGISPEDTARQEEKNAEVLLAMLVAASEESKRREAEEGRKKESGIVGLDDDGAADGDAPADPEHWYERHMRLRNAVRSDLLRDDGHALYGHHASYYSRHRRTSDVRVFRPQRSGGGMALHYIVVRDTVLVGRICGLLLGSAEATAASAVAASTAESALRSGSTVASDGDSNGKAVSFDVAANTTAAGSTPPAGPTISAAVIAVGISGCNAILGTSELVPTLPLRFADSITLLQGLGIVSAKSVKAAAAATTSDGGSKYKATSANNLTSILSEARRYARSTWSATAFARAHAGWGCTWTCVVSTPSMPTCQASSPIPMVLPRTP